MTNKIAIGIGLIVLGLLAFDAVAFGWSNTLFVLRKTADMIEWMAFWR